MNKARSLVSVAVGNTSSRAVLWTCGPAQEWHTQGRSLCTAETAALRAEDGTALPQFVASLRQLVMEEVEVVIGAGSVPAVEVLLYDALRSAGAPFVDVLLLHRRVDPHDKADVDDDERHRAQLVEELGLRVVPSPPWRVGKDRLCAALGALALDLDVAKPSSLQAWVVVDSGTALTVNAVWASPATTTTSPEVGVFGGGLIMPGEGLMLRSLSSGTAQLPSLAYWPLTDPPPLVGQSTEEAIRAGVRHLHVKGAVAVIKSLVNDLKNRDQSSAQVRVVVTGGGGQALAEALAAESDAEELQPRYDPLLVHRGLHFAWRLRLQARQDNKPSSPPSSSSSSSSTSP